MNTQFVVYVIGSLGKGGAETQLVMLMKGLTSSEFKPILFVLDAMGPLRTEVAETGIRIVDGGYHSPRHRLTAISQLVRALWRLWRLLVQSRASVVHGYLPLANLCAALAGRLAFTPLVITSRRALNTHQDRFPNWLCLDKLGAWLSHVVITNSEAVSEDTQRREGAYHGKLCVVHNGIDSSLFAEAALGSATLRKKLGLSSQDAVLISVANLIPYKGHADLIEALGQLSPLHPELRLLIVGEDRGIQANLEVQAERLGIADKIHWLGMRHDIPELLGIADIYVCASHEEGFSNALLEAMAAGKVVVATKVGGNSEMLKYGEFGVLVEPHDAASLMSAFSRILDAPSQYTPVAKSAAVWVASHYTPKKMIESYIELYRSSTPHRG